MTCVRYGLHLNYALVVSLFSAPGRAPEVPMSELNQHSETPIQTQAEPSRSAHTQRALHGGGAPAGGLKPSQMSLNGWIGSLMDELDDKQLPRA